MKRRSSPAASVVDEGLVKTATIAVADVPKDDADGWDLEGAVALDEVQRLGAKYRLGDFQDSFRAKSARFPEPLQSDLFGHGFGESRGCRRCRPVH